jgi:hypothetical protein
MEQGSSLLLTLAQPQWFVPLFIVFWLFVSAVFSRVAGWRSLGRQFAASAAPGGQGFRFVSGSVGSVHWPVRYRNCLHVVVGEAGLYARPMFPFGFQSPALLLPWAAVESMSEKQSFTNRAVTFRFRGHWPVVTLLGPVGQLAKAAYEGAVGSQ